MKNPEKLTKLIKLLEDFNQGNWPWRTIIDVKVEIQRELQAFLSNTDNDHEEVRPIIVTHYDAFYSFGLSDATFSDLKADAELLELQLKAYRLDG